MSGKGDRSRGAQRRLARWWAPIAAALALAAPTVAQANDGALDRSFGDGGRTILRATSQTETTYPPRQFALAAAQNGHTAVVVADRLFLLADGKPLASFGGREGVAIAPPPNTRFLPGGVAVDSRERVLVAGTAESTLAPTPAPPGLEGPRASAVVYRFLSNGQPDLGFGSGGVLVTDLGQKPPAENPLGPYPYDAAALKVNGLAVDGEDRPVLLGSSVSALTSCGYSQPHVGYKTRTFVARLTVAGQPDPSFGEAGIYTNPGREYPDDLALSPNGKVLFSSPTEALCPRVQGGEDEVVNFLGVTGQAARSSFVDKTGTRSETMVQSLAVDRRNRVVLLLRVVPPESGGVSRAAFMRRLHSSGSLDIGFGEGGTARAGFAPEGIGAVGLDSQGRILVAQSTATEAAPSNRLVVVRFGTAGRLDHSYGQRGRISAAFGAKSVMARPALAIDSRGRAVVAAPIGKAEAETSRFLALARFSG